MGYKLSINHFAQYDICVLIVETNSIKSLVLNTNADFYHIQIFIYYFVNVGRASTNSNWSD